MYSERVLSRLLAGFGAFLVVIILIALAVLVFQIIVTWKVYQKAGKGGWEAIVPYYNTWVLCEITGIKWWFFLIMNAASIASLIGLVYLVPLAGLAALLARFAANYNLALKFGKEPIGYGIGLTLVPVIFYAILAFGNDSFTDVKVSAYGPISEDKVNKPNNTTQEDSKKPTSNKNNFCKNCGTELDGGKFCPNCGTEIHK